MYFHKILMLRQDFTYEQKREIILRKIGLYYLICPIYGIFKCPSCWCKMAIGHECKKDGENYKSRDNYLSIHKELGYKPIPREYTNISRVEIDHLDCCFYGGQATFENGVMICENCNKIFREFLNREDKLFLLNGDVELMDCDNISYRFNNSTVEIIQNGKKIFQGKDIINSILQRRKSNKLEIEITPMYD